MKLDSLMALYTTELSDLLSAEEQMTKALPAMAKAASSPALRSAIEAHLAETQQHAGRLKEIFDSLGAAPRPHFCEAMGGIIAEGKEIVGADGGPEVKDAGLIAAAQRAEHYEIAGYGCAAAFARILGRENDVTLLQRTLNEEHSADKKLTEIAEGSVNAKAAAV